MKHLLLATLLLATEARAGELLLGTIASTRADDSLALFGTTDGESFAMRRGQALRGWELELIEPRAVTMKRNNQRIRLTAGDLLEDGQKVAITTGIERRGDEIRVSRVLHDYIAGEGLVAMLMQAAAVPATKDGEGVGYALVDIDAGSAYELAGIQNGDVITHIDDTPLTNPLAALSMLKKIATSGSFTFTRLRAGVSSKISVQIL